jgi:DNA-binding response OmpR family regulator
MTRPRASILVVEDDAAIRNGLLDVFVFNGYEAFGEEDGARGLETALNREFDLLVLDLMLPSLDGFSICEKVRAQKPDQPILILTAKGSEDDVVKGFTCGADDYVNKPFSLKELMLRVEALLRRSGKTNSDLSFSIGGITFDPQTLIAYRGADSLELTRREMDIMAFLHKNRDRIVSKAQLLKDVWQYSNPDVETRTVDIHMLKLKKKLLTLDGSAPMIQTVRGQGYRLRITSVHP